MGRTAGRSRGCKNCLKRKIKCDENAPICRECSNANLECSGPRLGPVFIDMSNKIKRSTEIKRTKAPCRDSTGRDSDHIMFQFSLPTTYTPNAAPLFEQLYLSNLIVSYSCPEGQRAGLHMWIPNLPRMLASWENPVITYSSRATSMALYGRLIKSTTIAFQARKCYAKCLQLQKDSCRIDATGVQKSPNSSSLASIAATCLLAVFESTASTTPDGWVHHFSAAIRMLLLKGPIACQRGLANQLFRSLRLASPEWHNLPFVACQKSYLDDLVDILVQLPSCSFKVHKWKKDKSLRESADLRRQILEQTDSLLLRLDLFSELYDIERLTTAFQASFVAFFHSACLICLNYHSVVASVSMTETSRMEEHAEMILKCASYHKEAGIHSGGSFNMSFPLKIASLMPPSEDIRERAQDMISSWGDQRGLMDLFQAAYPLCT
ncbi:uncharacterized protein Z519_11520 [Cladophialophora bantiana CBS 173.52]|uniref:Zn(2)-C6 fungal-type domain-containing protein n=1 Tax=Cladophialophora bantiana (strain ATCC 10958 / CBS 173.52 / CDC B-1940 / NIH 8579) TaxID=1442370 RepID=A0A0D2HAJ8_CLAB1|nr:uncharacterized protein Z519_11520 [Cladophialophora bantiana CBS 173.52]KIW87935.1 hypothetical protein Z519_11520 [Cladophialophora bantiana CBS 173.52]